MNLIGDFAVCFDIKQHVKRLWSLWYRIVEKEVIGLVIE